MATIGYAGALGGMAKDAAIGAGKGFLGGLKGAMISEAPGIAGAYAFGKDLRKRANAPKMPSGGSAPPANKPSSSSSVAGGLGTTNDKSIVGSLRQSNIINLEQIRQLKQLNSSVINQSKLIAYQINDTKRKDQFAEEVAKEQSIRDDALLQAIKRIGTGGSTGKQSSNDSKGGPNSLLGKIGDFISDNIGTLIGGYLGYKGVGAAGRVLGGIGRRGVGTAIAGRAVPQIGMAGRAAASNIIDVQAKVISSTAARGALAEGIGTIVPMVLRFLTGPVGLGIMAAAGAFGLLKLASNPNYVPGSGRTGRQRVDSFQAKDSKVSLTKDQATDFLKDADNRRTYDSKLTPEQNKIKIDNADRDLNEYGGRQRLENIAKGLPEYRTPGKGVVSSIYGKRDSPGGVGSTDHKGVDFKMNVGTPIYPIADGIVIEANSTGGATGLGRFVKIQHADGTVSTYGHLSAVEVKKNERVTLDKILGKSGGDKGTDTGAGASTGPHLHLEVTKGGQNINPASLPGLGAAGEMGRSVQGGMYTSAKVPGAPKSPTGVSQKSRVISSSAGSNAGPLAEEYKENDAKIAEIKNSSFIKNSIITSLSGKSLEQLTVFRKQVDNITSLNASDKSEVLSAIDEEIKKKTVVLKSDALGGQLSEVDIAAMMPDFSQRYPGVQYASLNTGVVSDAGGGGGSKFRVAEKAVLVRAPDVVDAINTNTLAQGFSPITSQAKVTSAGYQGNPLLTKAFKPLFKSNSEILQDANKAFLRELRSSFTNIFNTGLNKVLFPKGPGVSAGEAGRDDMFRGQQLQKIFGTSDKINSATTKLLGKQYGPMFAPLFDNLAQGYLEVGSRVAGKAIFQGIGDLDAKETMTLTGQVLGNLAAGNKKLALEQLLYGASGGKESGIALGAETLFAKYGFANPMEGISYFASALGEKATQPFAKLMGADDRDKSIIFDPRTKQHVYADTGMKASQADINAAGVGYGGRTSQTPIFDPRMNNYGTASDPYGTTAGTGGNVAGGITNDMLRGGSVFRQISNARPGQEISRAQTFGLTEEAQARGGAKLIAEQNTLIRAQGEVQNKQLEQQAKLAEESAKRQLDIAMKQANSQAEADSAQAAFDKALNEAKTSTDRVDTDRVISKLDQVGGKPSGGGTEIRDKDGNLVTRRSGQLFGQSYDKDGRPINDPMKEIGNFGFDMFKNALGGQLTKGIKNPYAQMVANFVIQKGLNSGLEAVMKSDFVSNMFSDTGGSFLDTVVDKGSSFLSDIFSFFTGADGGPVTGPGTSRSDSIPAMLSNGEFVVNAESTKKYRPLLDALNVTKYANGTPSTPGSGISLSENLGIATTNASLGEQTDLLTSIDTSLLKLSGGRSSGTSISSSSYGGTAFDIGLGSPYSGGVSGGGNTVNGVARGQKPSTMDYVTAIGKSLLINKGISMASTAVFGASPLAIAGNFAQGVSTGFTLGADAFAGDVIATVGTQAGVTTGATLAEIGAIAGPVLGYIIAAYIVYEVVDSIYGGDGPPPKEPKFHAAMYVVGNNNPNAISPIYETTDYNAVPDVYKTMTYGLLRVAFNASKSAEAVTKITPPWDWLYMKVQFDKISLIWGKGAPSRNTISADSYPDNMSWPLTNELQLNTVASDIIDRITKEFKAGLAAENANLAKLDTAAAGLKNYTLNELSTGLINELKSGNLKLDPTIEKGIYSNNVAESNRIAALINAANTNAAYISKPTSDEFSSGDDPQLIKAGTVGGVNMVYSIKQGKFVKNPYGLDTILLDEQDRPVYNIEGTSAGLTIDDFVSAEKAGTRTANILAPPVTAGSAAGGGATVVNAPSVVTTDASSLTNYYQTQQTTIDALRAAQTQTG